MTFLLPYNVRCDALHLNCSIMISWNLFFALHNIHTTHRIPGDFSRLRLKVEKFLFASFCTHKRLFAHNMYKYKGIFFGLHISVWLQFKSYVNVRRLLKILFLQYFFHHIPHSSNNYKCAYYLFMLHNDQSPHQPFHNIFCNFVRIPEKRN